MVDWYGRWSYDPDTPEDKKCDYDYLADWIVSLGYQVKTNLEWLIDIILMRYDNYLQDIGTQFYGIEDNRIEDIKCFVEEDGGLAEFDYVEG